MLSKKVKEFPCLKCIKGLSLLVAKQYLANEVHGKTSNYAWLCIAPNLGQGIKTYVIIKVALLTFSTFSVVTWC